jgi:hypothetical protein
MEILKPEKFISKYFLGKSKDQMKGQNFFRQKPGRQIRPEKTREGPEKDQRRPEKTRIQGRTREGPEKTREDKDSRKDQRRTREDQK